MQITTTNSKTKRLISAQSIIYIRTPTILSRIADNLIYIRGVDRLNKPRILRNKQITRTPIPKSNNIAIVVDILSIK